MKVSADVRRRVLLNELKKAILRYDSQSMTEVPFSHFMPTKRKFRADFYCPNRRTIIEVNGGQFISGRHNRGGTGYENDLEKLNLAQQNGFKIYQFTYEILERGVHLILLRQ